VPCDGAGAGAGVVAGAGGPARQWRYRRRVHAPSTHQTLQLKGLDAEIVAPAAEDRSVCAAWQESFVAELLELGYEERFARGVFAGLTDELVAVRFTPDAAFEQTPGPSAGQQLGSDT